MALIVSAFSSTIALKLYAGVRRDGRRVAAALLAAMRGCSLPPGRGLSSPEAEHIWGLIVRLSGERRNERFGAEQLVSAWKRTAPSRDCLIGVERAAAALLKVLVNECAPEVQAAAFLQRERRSGPLRVTQVVGPHAGRLELPILNHCQFVLDSFEQSVPPKGVRVPVPATSGLPLFGIRGGVLLQLDDGADGFGLIWLGMKSAGSALSELELKVIDAILANGKAFIDAASETSKIVKAESFDREVILGMSHDLKAPANSALFALDALLNDELRALPGEASDYLRIVEDAVREQQRLVADLLDYARNRRGKLQTEPGNFKLLDLLAAVVAREKIAANAKGLEFEADIPSDIYVTADPRHTARIVSNLLSNAVKYTKSGRVQIEASVQGELLRVTVSDTGPGIGVDEGEALFSPFKRLSSAAGTSGSGLGLAVSRLLAEVNSGELLFSQAESGGSRFTLTLPACLSPKVSDQIGRESILVVEDDGPTRRTLQRMLEEVGYRVIAAGNLPQARAVFDPCQHKAVVSDLKLQGEDASEFLSAAAQHVPVIIFTGVERSEICHQLRKVSGIALLEKPIRKSVLNKALADSLSREAKRLGSRAE